jgi:hypothetical protein
LFSKQDEILQVQLLVTDSDVENYNQIKTDLDELRNLVEKSELWVYKEKKGDDSKKKKSGDKKNVICSLLYYLYNFRLTLLYIYILLFQQINN